MARPTDLRTTLPGLRRVLLRFRGYARPERPLLLAGSAAVVFEVVLRLLEPWPLKFVFDAALDDARAVPFGLSPQQLLISCAVATLVLVTLRALAGYSSSVGFALAGNRVLTRVRADLYRHVQTLGLSFDAGKRTGDLVTRMVSDVGILKEVVVTALLPLATSGLVLVGMLVMMVWLDPLLALVALVPLPLVALFTLRRSKHIQTVGRVQRQREGDLATTAAETVATLQVVQTLSLQEHFARAFTAANDRDLREGVKGKRLAAGLERSVDVGVGISTALVLWLGATRALDGLLSPGDLVVFLTYQRRAFRPVRDLAKYAARLAKATAAGERVLEVLEQEPSVRDRTDAVAAPPLRGALTLRGVRYAYAPGRDVLCGLDLEISAGERVAILGASGAGKSTLLRLLLRLIDPQAGAIRVDGRDVREFTLDSLRSQMAVVLQDATLFAGTIRENIACGTPVLDPERVEAAGRLARVDVFARRFPDGYDTLVGEGGTTLSRGERQRVAIARAAVRDAPLWILDEPLTGLDGEQARWVAEALDDAVRGRTCLTITHEAREAARCDRVVLIEAGRIVESGSPSALLASGGRYADMVSAQSSLREVERVALG